jgi:rhodanese-related sulfurtransferase
MTAVNAGNEGSRGSILSCGRILMKRAWGGAVWIALLATLPAIFLWAHLVKAERAMLPYEVTLNDPRLPKDGLVWVDARSQDEYEQGHVTNAVLLNEERWDAMLGDLFGVWAPPRPIIVYCNAGCQASEKVAQRLRDLGMDPVYFLKGGYDIWKRSHTEAQN